MVTLPQSLIAGDSFELTLEGESRGPGEGWACHLRLVPRSAGQSVQQLEATVVDGVHRFAVGAATSAAWAAGHYMVTLWVTRGDESVTLTTQQLQILPNPRTAAAGIDTRSTARKALDDLNAALAAWNPLRKSYTIGDRTMEFNSTAEIIKLINHWQLQVDAEDRTAGRKARMPRRIYTRL